MTGPNDINLDFDLNFALLAKEAGDVENKPVAEMPVTETQSQTGSTQRVVAEEMNLQLVETGNEVPTESKRPIEMEAEPDVLERIDAERENDLSETEALSRKLEEEKAATQAMLNQQLHSLALLSRTEKEEQAAGLAANKAAAVATQQRIEAARKSRDEAKRRVLLEEELKAKESFVAQRERELQERIAEKIAVAQRAEAAKQERMAEEAAAIEAENRVIAVEKAAIERASARRAKIEESRNAALKSLLEKQVQERELLKRAETEAVANLEAVKLAEYVAQQRLDAENDAQAETRRRISLESELRERELATVLKERELQAQIAERIEMAKRAEEAVQERIAAELLQTQTEQGKREEQRVSIVRVNEQTASLENPAQGAPMHTVESVNEQVAEIAQNIRQVTEPEQNKTGLSKRRNNIGSLLAFSGWAVAAVLIVLLLIQFSVQEKAEAPTQQSLMADSKQAVRESIPATDAENVVSLKMTTELPRPGI